MSNPNFLSANPSGLESMQANSPALGYDVNRIVAALTGVNLVPISIGSLTVAGTIKLTGGASPATPTALAATATSKGFVLTWIEISPGTISPKQYEIGVSTFSDFGAATKYFSVDEDVVVISSSSYLPGVPSSVTVGPGNYIFIAYPSSGTLTVFPTYYFRIRSTDWAGNQSGWSSIISAQVVN